MVILSLYHHQEIVPEKLNLRQNWRTSLPQGQSWESKMFWLSSSACCLCAPCSSWLVITEPFGEQHCYRSAALLKLKRLKTQYCKGLPGLSGEVEFFRPALFSLLKQSCVMLRRHLCTCVILVSMHFPVTTQCHSKRSEKSDGGLHRCFFWSDAPVVLRGG